MKKFFLTISAFLCATSVFSQARNSSQAHLSEITNLSHISSDGSVFSAGTDGFVIKWNNEDGEHYQLTDYEIKLIARNPANNNEIAIYETNGASLHKVTVWNWSKFTKRYGYFFTDSITSLAFSSKGSFLICGTTSVNGAYFINNSSGSLIQNKIKDNTGVVNMAVTSPTEKNIAIYSPSGTLTYYNLRNGQKQEKLNVEKNLSQGTMFNNFVFFAGVKDRSLYVYDARLGKLLGRFSTSNPILINTNDRKDLFYLESENRQVKLYKIANDRNKAVIQPELVNTVSGLKEDEIVTTASIFNDEIIAGTTTGNIYRLPTDATSRVEVISAISQKMYDKLYDIASVGSDFYFLSPKDLYLSSYDRGEVDRKAANPGYTNIITYGTDVILWSKNTAKPVQLMDVSTGTCTTLFTPTGKIRSLKLFGENLVEIQGNTTVNSYNIQTKKYEQLYLGSGIQDAVLYSDTDLYVAKSSASYPQVPLIYINTTTKETVPLSLKGTVCFSLSYDASISNSDIYGIVIGQDSKQKPVTSIFSLTPSSKSFRMMNSEAGEDPDAFTTLSMPNIYTNIGKSLVQSLNISSNRKFTYKRSASMPVKMARNENRLVILNRDGSISWYNPDMSNVINDWYLTVDGSWFEF